MERRTPSSARQPSFRLSSRSLGCHPPSFRPKQLRPGPATPAASHVEFLVCFVTAGRRNDRFGPTAHPPSRAARAAFAGAGCRSMIADQKILRSRARNRCGGQQPILLRRARGGGGRNARATSSRLRAFPECPPAVHPRKSPAVAGSAAIIQQARNAHVFADAHFPAVFRGLQQENAIPLCRSCGRPLFPVEDRGKLRI